jgi:hypothetical protein
LAHFASASAALSVTTSRWDSLSALRNAWSRADSSAGATRTSVSVGGPPDRKMTPKPKSIRSGNRNVQNIAPRSRT